MRTRPDVTEIVQLEHGSVEIDEAGYLVDPSGWTREFALMVGQAERVVPGALHWRVFDFMRAYLDDHGVCADARHVIAFLSGALGLDRQAAKRKLFELFPEGYVKQACKMAGMRQPRAWSTG